MNTWGKLIQLLLVGFLIASLFAGPPNSASRASQANIPESANILVSPTAGLVTSESGGQATLIVRLSSRPYSAVHIPLTRSDTAEGVLASTELVLNHGNWDRANLVTVTGVDDTRTDGDVAYTVALGPASSDDARYNGMQGAVVSLTNLDNDFHPQANDDSDITRSNTPVITTVLANDQGLAPPVNVSISKQPAHGSASGTLQNRILFIPDQNFHGIDWYRYQVCNTSKNCSSAKVTITITPIDATPVANDDNYTTVQNSILHVDESRGVLSNDYSPYTTTQVLTTTNPTHGAIIFLNKDNGAFDYQPQTGFLGVDNFQYLLSTENLTSTVATVTITITAQSKPLQAINDSYILNLRSGTTLDVSAPGVLGNDVNNSAIPAEAALDQGPNHGTMQLDSTGAFSYTPETAYNGTDQFTYRLVDGQFQSDPTTVEILIDQQTPIATWILPTIGGQRFNVSDGTIHLEVEASDNIGVDHVKFFRWDAVNEVYLDIATVTSAPFAIDLDTSTLNPEWNQIFVKAFDAAGNESPLPPQHIWLYKIVNKSAFLYLPILMQQQ